MKEMRKWPMPEYEIKIRKRTVSEYLKNGSVNELLRTNRHNPIPMSEPSIHRLIRDWGIIKAAGPNKPLSETISFFVKLVEKEIPIETLYGKMPPSFTQAVASLHRTYHNLKENVKKRLEERDLRRVATALVITPEGNPERVLVGFDVSPRRELGKPYGSVSVPMGFSKRTEKREDSILRILQQEVFMEKVVERTFPKKIIPEDPRPFMYVDVADIRVAVYSMVLPKELSNVKHFSSHKLKKHQFLAIGELGNFGNAHILRVGLPEIFEGYADYIQAQNQKETYSAIYKNSWLNRELEQLIVDQQKLRTGLAV